MALIDVTIENPSLVNTGGEGSQTTASSSGTDENGDVDPEAEFEEPASDAAAETDDDLAETLKTISTLLTAATTVAGVLKKLRSEEEGEAGAGSAVDVAEGLFEDEEVGGEEEVESFEEELVEEDNETEADADEEGEEADDEEPAEDDSGRGPGLKVAFVLVVLLVALALWTRGDDEESELDEDWE